LIASNSATPEGITNGTAIDLYVSALAIPQTTLAATDRLAVRIYVTHSGRTIKLHTENSHLCQVITTFSTGLTALNGLTAQVQNFATGTSGTDFAISSATSTHTFNLPTASAANRGALSSADWSAFNGKFTLPALTSGSVLFSNGTTIAQDNANLFFDDTNNRLGIGTSSPQAKLEVFGTNELLRFGDGTSGNDAFMSFNSRGYIGFKGSGGLNFIANTTRPIIFGVGANFSTFTEAARFAATTGNFLIGTTTDAGFKLDVNGSVRVSGAFRADNTLLVNGTSINASAIAQFDSGTRGFLPPRMTTTQKNAIATPAAGLVVYDTTLGKLCVRGAAAWETITSI
jgi:hypothetical protein